MHSHDYDHLVEAQQGVIANGYTEGFIWKDDCLMTQDKSKCFQVGDLVSVEEYRFEGMTNPGDESILIVLEANDGTKGYAISSYGPTADEKLVKFLDEVPKRRETVVTKRP